MKNLPGILSILLPGFMARLSKATFRENGSVSRLELALLRMRASEPGESEMSCASSSKQQDEARVLRDLANGMFRGCMRKRFVKTSLVLYQGGPQLKILACCMAKNLDIVRECMCAKREDPCGWGPRPAQGPWKLWDCSLSCYISLIFCTFDHKWVVIQG